MPYQGEFASYQPLRRMADSERVKQLLKKSRVFKPTAQGPVAIPTPVPETDQRLPDFVVAIDGSNAEVDVVNGYPGAKVGYCTVASVLLNLKKVNELDEARPVNPADFRETEEAATIDAALPGSNVVTRDHVSARDSFRESLFEIFHDEIVDEDDHTRLLQTYEELLAKKPTVRPQSCPYDYDGCDEHFNVGAGISSCTCAKQRAIYSTDALRIYERFREVGSNGESLGEVMQVWERVLFVHLLRCFERRGWLSQMNRLAFILDGPLALFGHPAWLSAAISAELKRINAVVRKESGKDLLLIGIEKSGAFVDHFDEVDRTEEPGEVRFPPRSCFLPDDRYIKQRIIYSTSDKRYGLDTYFGRKLFYKTASGARIVATIPFLTEEQDTLDATDIGAYPQIPTTGALLDKLVSSRFPNAVSPIIAAHAQAAIPLHLGAKVLQQLARALMRGE
ncbi:MAG: DNA double-strand break repair nuclease NurA [Dehalococcoidia bacterium]